MVTEFLLNYCLFAAKLVTLAALLIFTLSLILSLIASRRPDKESLEIENINEKFELMQTALEEELLSKAELKLLGKEKKRQDKEDNKAEKLRLKQGIEQPLRPRLFVLRFMGDMAASEINTFREAITAVISVAKTTDEVLVILESAGGLVHEYGLAASQLQRIKDQDLQLTVSIDRVAASGGYLMACVADKILAAPFAIVGSIGVFAELPNFHRLLEKHHIDIEHHTAGEYKTTLTMLGKNTDKAREKFKQELQETHDLFKDFVQSKRPSLEVSAVATGEHWYGSQALNLRLVDELMTSDDYLLTRHKDCDIFEVAYVIQETLKDKLSMLLEASISKGWQSLQRFLSQAVTSNRPHF